MLSFGYNVSLLKCQNYYTMIKLHNLLALLLLLQICISNRCSDNSQCFLKKLFDFSFPQEGVYSISLGNSPDTMNNQIRSYGDFNNDLRADYVSIGNNGSILVYIYSINDGQYILQSQISIWQGCSPINFYLYDVNGDNSLDITVWGAFNNGTNCLYPLIQSNLEFTANPSVMPFSINTTQPSLFETNIDLGGNQIRTNCLLVFYNGQRSILYFNKTEYIVNNWANYFSGDPKYITTPFSSPHWNTFIDLTNDCFPDFVLTNQNNNNQIEIWIYNIGVQKFLFNSNTPPLNNIGTIAALNILDINYDGGLDIIVANNASITMFISDNHLSSSSTFCVSGSTSYSYNWNNPKTFSPQCTLITQNLQFADLNIDGYPELMLICSTGLMIYQNNFASGSTFALFNEYQDAVNSNINNPKKIVQTASFFDILQNGIIDIIVTLNATNSSMALYNNYLYQNSFYIKGYATNGKTSSAGTQIPGASFYWMNSVGSDQKITIACQITQTAYNAMPMPYVVGGLGRANNFVEMFSMGRLGQIKPWSPIIPNSQLAIFSGNSDSGSWAIKIFIMPTDSLVYVVIVCIVILAILGTVLLVLKCKRKKLRNLYCLTTCDLI